MLKKMLIAAAIAVASFGTNAEAATQEVYAQYHTELGTFKALEGAQKTALMQVPSTKWAKIVKYLELGYPDRNTCYIKCVVEYE